MIAFSGTFTFRGSPAILARFWLTYILPICGITSLIPFHVINTLITLRITNNALLKISHEMLLILITLSAIWRRGLFTFARKLAKTSSKNWICCRKFCLWRYVNDIGDILKLNWLPVEERRDLLKLTFKALHAKEVAFIFKLTESLYMFEVFGLFKITSSSAKKEPSRILRLPFLITFQTILRSVTTLIYLVRACLNS